MDLIRGFGGEHLQVREKGLRASCLTLDKSRWRVKEKLEILWL